MIVRTFAAAALALALCSSALAAPAKTTAVDVGSARLYAQNDEGAMLAGLQLFVRAGLDRQTPAQNGLAALSAEALLRAPAAGGTVRDAIAARGGSISYSVGPQYVRFYLEAPPEAMSALAPLAARAFTMPDTSNATIAAARAALGAKIAEEERNPVSVGLAMLRQSYYDGGAGLPTLGTTTSIAMLAGSDVRAFVAAHYRRGNAVITVVGRVTDGVTAAAAALANALPDGAEAPSTTKAKAFPAVPKRIITHRDVGVPYLVLGFAAPPVGSTDFGAMLVLRSLLADVFDRPSATTLPAYARAVGVVYNYDTKPASIALYVNGSQLDPTAGLTGIEAVLRGIANKPLVPALLKRYKTSAHGEWLTESVSLADRAWLIGNFVEHGAGPDDGQTVLAAIDGVTSADVRRVAKTYLQRFTVALIIPRDTPQT